jgi:hypothetical protein
VFIVIFESHCSFKYLKMMEIWNTQEVLIEENNWSTIYSFGNLITFCLNSHLSLFHSVNLASFGQRHTLAIFNWNFVLIAH